MRRNDWDSLGVSEPEFDAMLRFVGSLADALDEELEAEGLGCGQYGRDGGSLAMSVALNYLLVLKARGGGVLH